MVNPDPFGSASVLLTHCRDVGSQRTAAATRCPEFPFAGSGAAQCPNANLYATAQHTCANSNPGPQRTNSVFHAGPQRPNAVLHAAANALVLSADSLFCSADARDGIPSDSLLSPGAGCFRASRPKPFFVRQERAVEFHPPPFSAFAAARLVALLR
jgi:hypothetical protein